MKEGTRVAQTLVLPAAAGRCEARRTEGKRFGRALLLPRSKPRPTRQGACFAPADRLAIPLPATGCGAGLAASWGRPARKLPGRIAPASGLRTRNPRATKNCSDGGSAGEEHSGTKAGAASGTFYWHEEVMNNACRRATVRWLRPGGLRDGLRQQGARWARAVFYRCAEAQLPLLKQGATAENHRARRAA
jgi:hypothetical protein